MLTNRYITCVLLSLFLFIFTNCKQNTVNFSQYPGFAEYFEANPPARKRPDQRDQELLYRFRPRFMLPQGHQKPIDFYRDYIANGILKDGDGRVISRSVTREILNAHKDDPEAVFVHIPGRERIPAVAYGSILRKTVTFHTPRGQRDHLLTFLGYNLVFRNSGLPAGIPVWHEVLLGLISDPEDWHQLDHYTAVFLVLEGEGHNRNGPLAVMLQQHNNVRTYLDGEGVVIPSDGRVVVDVAIRSNELYPHVPGRNLHRAVNLPDPEGMLFLMSGEDKPVRAGYDITEGVEEARYTLEFLPSDDAFYTFKGFLGERRLLPGRTGPPGAEYNTLPELKPIHIQLFSGYWRENHKEDLKRFHATIMESRDYAGFARLQGVELYRNWKRLRKHAGYPAR